MCINGITFGFLLTLSLWSGELAATSTPLEKDEALSPQEKQRVYPHLLPTDHPTRTWLDSNCKRSRISGSRNLFEKAGFQLLQYRLELLVGIHPHQPDYVVKVYSDQLPSKKQKAATEALLTRVETAQRMRRVVEEEHLSHITIPQKWLYLLPSPRPAPPRGSFSQQPLLLIEERLPILSEQETEVAWKREETWNEGMIDDLFAIFSRCPIRSIKFENIRLTKDLAQVALFDLEEPVENMEEFHKRLAKQLPPKWYDYWLSKRQAAANQRI